MKNPLRDPKGWVSSYFAMYFIEGDSEIRQERTVMSILFSLAETGGFMEIIFLSFAAVLAFPQNFLFYRRLSGKVFYTSGAKKDKKKKGV
jgi:hypothetical protein